jgi:hypothetical protein
VGSLSKNEGYVKGTPVFLAFRGNAIANMLKILTGFAVCAVNVHVLVNVNVPETKGRRSFR